VAAFLELGFVVIPSFVIQSPIAGALGFVRPSAVTPQGR
jgi:hypothetical protein